MKVSIHTSHIIAAIIALIISAIASDAKAQRTTRRGLKQIETTAAKSDTTKSHIDTIATSSTLSNVIISGYDKPLRAAKETLFISNHTDKDICGLRILLEYIDSKKRTLHKIERHISIEIPAGETRQAAFKSWDIQKSFYYKRSYKPRSADGTSYDVRCQIVSIDIPSAPTNTHGN